MNLKTFNLVYRLIFFLIAFSFFTINLNVISADENIVEDFRFTSMIPEGIQFSIDVSDVSLIEDIQVKFKIDGRKTVQYEYVEIPEDLSLLTLTYFFSTSKADRYIPPGSSITYYFELFFKDGTKLRTEQKKGVVLDSRFEWNKVSGEIVDIYFHGPVGRRANKLLEACEKTVTQMSNLLGVTEKKPISVIMYNNYSEMFDVVVKSGLELPLISCLIQITELRSKYGVLVLLLTYSAHRSCCSAKHLQETTVKWIEGTQSRRSKAFSTSGY